MFPEIYRYENQYSSKLLLGLFIAALLYDVCPVLEDSSWQDAKELGNDDGLLM